MKNFRKKVIDLVKKKNITIEILAEKIGTSKQNLYQVIKKEDVSVLYLEKISAALNISITYFFDVEPAASSVLPVASLENESDKDKKIKYLRRKNKQLEEDVKLFKSLLSK